MLLPIIIYQIEKVLCPQVEHFLFWENKGRETAQLIKWLSHKHRRPDFGIHVKSHAQQHMLLILTPALGRTGWARIDPWHSLTNTVFESMSFKSPSTDSFSGHTQCSGSSCWFFHETRDNAHQCFIPATETKQWRSCLKNKGGEHPRRDTTLASNLHIGAHTFFFFFFLGKQAILCEALYMCEGRVSVLGKCSTTELFSNEGIFRTVYFESLVLLGQVINMSLLLLDIWFYSVHYWHIRYFCFEIIYILSYIYYIIFFWD